MEALKTQPAPPLRLTAPGEALALLRPFLRLAGVETLSVAHAVGLVLAEPIRAAAPVPAVATALRDGWAVLAAETLGAGPYSPVPIVARAIRAGEALPPGTDAVLPPYDADADGPFAQALATLAPGEGARLPGEDLEAGAVLRVAGEKLAVRDLPGLAALGIGAVAVRRPRVALRPLGAPDAAVMALLAAMGGGVVRDGPADLLLLLAEPGEAAAAEGASAISAAGRLLCHGIGARPGMGAALGLWGETPALLLPGGVEEALGAWLLLGAPILAALSGAQPPTPLYLRLRDKVASTVGIAECVPLALDGRGQAVPLAVGGFPLSVLSAAIAVLVVSPDSEGYEAGSLIAALPL